MWAESATDISPSISIIGRCKTLIKLKFHSYNIIPTDAIDILSVVVISFDKSHPHSSYLVHPSYNSPQIRPPPPSIYKFLSPAAIGLLLFFNKIYYSTYIEGGGAQELSFNNEGHSLLANLKYFV